MKLPHWINRQFKKKARIYIIPTRLGGYLCGLIFLMFLLSVGYSNNLLLIFTLLLFGLNLVWLVQTHFHLHALVPLTVQIDEGHAQEGLMVTIQWKRAPPEPHRWMVSLENERTTAVAEPVSNVHGLTGLVTLQKRGVHEFQHLLVRTEMPFGLYRAWVYYPVKVRAVVYPALLKELSRLPVLPATLAGEQSSSTPGIHDVWNLAPYQGEESRRISWKHYARLGELVVKEGEEAVSSMVALRMPGDSPNRELELSRLAMQMLHCYRSDVAFSFDAGLRKHPMAQGKQHLIECLRELARC